MSKCIADKCSRSLRRICRFPTPNIFLASLLPKAAATLPARLPGHYALVTLHRPSNVDDLAGLKSLLDALTAISATLPIIFPVHPRTRQQIAELGLSDSENLQLWEPQSYLSFLALQQKATVVITDSGGIQEETTFLGVPCLTEARASPDM
jgi:UDP-N-acetylglucosamine 2-epimerase (non-hydrolysing)